jgi:hypothetical protein
VLDPEERPCALRRQALDVVDDPVALVVAPARVTLGVLVHQARAARGEHRCGHVVLGCDQAKGLELTLPLGADQAGDVGVMRGERGRYGGHGHLRLDGVGTQARGENSGAPLPGGRFHLSASHGTRAEA